MARYVVSRLLQAVFVVTGVSALVFIVLFVSGDPTYLYVSEHANAAAIDEVRHKLGFDRPLWVQYATFAVGVTHGDFGNSLRSGQPAMEAVLQHLPATVELTIAAMLVAVGGAIPIGVVAARRRGSATDGSLMAAAMLGQSMPAFWLGILLIIVFGLQLRVLPISGRVPLLEELLGGNVTGFISAIPDSMRHLVLPAFTAGLWSLSRNSRLIRSSMLEVLGADYLTTARAKGLSEQTVVYRHALKNALLPVVTIIGLEFGFLLSGDIVVEVVFGWPGVGRLVVDAVNAKDFPVVQASVFVLALVFVVLSLGLDILYGWLDPRIRYR